MAGKFQHRNGSAGSMKSVEFFVPISDYQLIKKDSAAWSWVC